MPALQAEAKLPVGGSPQQPFKKGPYPQSGRSPLLLRREGVGPLNSPLKKGRTPKAGVAHYYSAVRGWDPSSFRNAINCFRNGIFVSKSRGPVISPVSLYSFFHLPNSDAV